MSTEPIAPPGPDAEFFRDAMHALITMTVDVARLTHESLKAQAAADPASLSPKTIAAFNETARSVRRNILMANWVTQLAQQRVMARKRIIREVEDSIQRNAPDGTADRLHRELLDRLDTLDLINDIDTRPVDAIIVDICRDLGLAHIPGTHPWKRRAPDDLALLHARATGQPMPQRARARGS
jgi:hypothetical protein